MNNELINEIVMDFGDNGSIDFDISNDNKLDFEMDGNTGGNYDYRPLSHKPSINGNVLDGNKLSKELGLQDEMDEITQQDIDRIIYG